MDKYVIEVKNKQNVYNAKAQAIKHDIIDLGIKTIEEIDTSDLYILYGYFTKKHLDMILKELLVDTVIQEGKIINKPDKKNFKYIVDIFYKKGVTDSVGESSFKAIRDIGIKTVREVHTGFRYYIKGNISKDNIIKISERLLANTVIQNYYIY